MFRNAKRFTAILLVLILAASTYAFAAANTITASNAGYATSKLSGWAISNIAYDFNRGANPVTVVGVVFRMTTLDAVPSAASTPVAVYINLTSNTVGPVAGAWTPVADCGSIVVLVADTSWTVTCALTTPITVTNVISFDVLSSTAADPTAP